MLKQRSTPPQKPGPVPPSATTTGVKARQKAEEREGAGRHKNDGAKDHQGAR